MPFAIYLMRNKHLQTYHRICIRKWIFGIIYALYVDVAAQISIQRKYFLWMHYFQHYRYLGVRDHSWQIKERKEETVMHKAFRVFLKIHLVNFTRIVLIEVQNSFFLQEISLLSWLNFSRTENNVRCSSPKSQKSICKASYPFIWVFFSFKNVFFLYL